MEVPLFKACITGKVLNQNLEYKPDDSKDEVEDLYRILKDVKAKLEAEHGYKVEGVSSGILLNSTISFVIEIQLIDWKKEQFCPHIKKIELRTFASVWE